MKQTILFILILLNTSVFAQNQEIDAQKVIVVDEFIPEIPDSYKINFNNNNNNDTVIIDSDFKYLLFDSHLKFSNENVDITAVKIKGHPVSKLYNAYIKGGTLLNSISPHVNFYYNSLRLANRKDFNWGIYGDHETFKFDNFNINSKITSVGSFIKKIEKHGIISSNLDYLSNNYNCYANNDDIKKYNLFSVKGEYNNLIKNQNNIDFDISIDAYNLKVDNSHQESAFELGANINHELFDKEFTTSLFVEFSKGGIVTSDFSVVSWETSTVFDFQSIVSWYLKDVHINSGFIYSYNESSHLYPYFEFLINDNSEYNKLSFLISGDYVQNNIIDRIFENQYLADSLDMLEQNQKFKFILNHSTKFSNSIFSQNNISFHDSRDMHIYNLDTNNRYMILYDDVKTLQFKSSFLYNYNKDINVRSVFVYSKFFMTDLSHAFFQPEIEFILETEYNYSDQISFSFSFDSGFKRWDSDGSLMNPISNADLRMNYQLNEFFNIDFIVNNIQFSDYQKWSNYSPYPTSFLIQLSYVL